VSAAGVQSSACAIGVMGVELVAHWLDTSSSWRQKVSNSQYIMVDRMHVEILKNPPPHICAQPRLQQTQNCRWEADTGGKGAHIQGGH